MKELTRQQQAVYDFVKSYIEKKSYPPTIREIGAAVGLSSTSTVHSHVKTLIDKGYLVSSPSTQRTIALAMPENKQRHVMDVPCVGTVAAGTPILAFDDVTESLPLPTSLLHVAAVYAGLYHALALYFKYESFALLRPMKQIQQQRDQNKEELVLYRHAPKFVPAGQSTQMIIGAMGESDYQIVSVAESLYKNFALKRVFYSAFVAVNEDKDLLMSLSGPPLLREHRLYQADWLMRFYGFRASELLSEKHPDFNLLLDPKADWAVSHLEFFPVEINQADYYELLRVPGIGYTSARRIIGARRTHSLEFADLKRIGVVLKRALYFITCNGRMMYNTRLEESYITRNLLDEENCRKHGNEAAFQQLSLFGDEMGSRRLYTENTKNHVDRKVGAI